MKQEEIDRLYDGWLAAVKATMVFAEIEKKQNSRKSKICGISTKSFCLENKGLNLVYIHNSIHTEPTYVVVGKSMSLEVCRSIHIFESNLSLLELE